jgi:hypothetical protein
VGRCFSKVIAADLQDMAESLNAVAKKTDKMLRGTCYNMYLVLLIEVYNVDDLSKSILLWLSPPDTSTNHNDAQRKCQIDSGGWLIGGRLLNEWVEKGNYFLWLQGDRT